MTEIVFAVFDAVQRVDGAALVMGVPDDTDICVGDVFTRLRGRTSRLAPDRKSFTPVDPGPTYVVELRIESIEAYGRFFDYMDSGIGCRLRLTGRGLELLEETRVLTGDVERPARRS